MNSFEDSSAIERTGTPECVESLSSKASEDFQHFIALRELRYMRDPQGSCPLEYGQQPLAQDSEARVLWMRASGRATLVSFTIYHHTYTEDFPAPYNVAWVELEEGPRLIATVTGVPLDALAVGMRLQAAFEASGRLVFEPAPSREQA